MEQIALIPHRSSSFDGDAFGHATEHPGRPSQTRGTLCERLVALLKSRPGEWIDGRELATVAGCYGWRTRVSEIRKAPYSLDVRNRQRREGSYVISEYMLVLQEGQDVV